MDRVEWLQSALDELAAMWLQADPALRNAITSASNKIDKQLKSDPFAASKPYSSGRRILFLPPLGVTFRIEGDGKTVTVVHTWMFRLHNGQRDS